MLWDVVHGLSRVIRKSIFIPSYDVLIITALTNVNYDFVDVVLVFVSRMQLVCQYSRLHFMRVF